LGVIQLGIRAADLQNQAVFFTWRQGRETDWGENAILNGIPVTKLKSFME